SAVPSHPSAKRLDHPGTTNRRPILLCGPSVTALGGGPTHVRSMLASPLRSDYQLVHFEIGSRGRESPATDEAAISKLVRIITSPVALACCIGRLGPQIVHLNSVLDLKAFYRDLVYLLVCKCLRCKVVLQLHGGALQSLSRSVLSRNLVRAVLALPDA